MNELPSGFVIDTPQAGALPGTVRDPMGPYFKQTTLPDGFQIDEAKNVTVAPKGVQQASVAPESGPSWAETFQTARQNLPSPLEYAKSQITNPITDIKNVGKLALGLGEKAIGTDKQYSNEQDVARDFLHHWVNYFSEKGLKENISQNPVGTMTDVLSFALPAKTGALGERAVAKADEIGARNLKSRAAAEIESAKDSGVHFTQPFSQELSQRLSDIALKNGYREGKHSMVTEALKTANRMAEGLPSFRSMHNLRQDINDAAGSRIESERNIGMQMKSQLDNAFQNLEKGTPEQIAQVVHAPPGVNPGDLAKRFKAGLTAYGAAKRVQEIQRIFDKADVHGFVWSQSGLANAIKTKFRQIYVNDKSLRKFSPDEQRLIRDIAKGNLTDQMLTFASKAAIRGPVSALVGHTIGGGPAGMAVIGGVGELAKRVLDRRQVGKVERLQHHIMAKGEGALRDAIGDTVYDHLNGTPKGAAAIGQWLKTKGSKTATRALALTIAQATNRTDLLPRINEELSAIGSQQNQ